MEFNEQPPRFGLESRGRNKDVNTRKLKELQKVKQQVINEKQKKEEEKKLKKSPTTPKKPVNNNIQPTTTTIVNNSQPQQQQQNSLPTLVFGADKDKESLYPQVQDYDSEDVCRQGGSIIYACKKIGNGFQDEVILSRDQKENIDIQRAIEQSIKEHELATRVVDTVVKEIEEEFELLCEDDIEMMDEDNDQGGDVDAWNNIRTPANEEIETWELLDEGSSSSLINLLSTPYSCSEKDFPLLKPSKKVHHQQQHVKCNVILKDTTNPWNQAKTLIDAISQSS